MRLVRGALVVWTPAWRPLLGGLVRALRGAALGAAFLRLGLRRNARNVRRVRGARVVWTPAGAALPQRAV